MRLQQCEWRVKVLFAPVYIDTVCVILSQHSLYTVSGFSVCKWFNFVSAMGCIVKNRIHTTICCKTPLLVFLLVTVYVTDTASVWSSKHKSLSTQCCKKKNRQKTYKNVLKVMPCESGSSATARLWFKEI